MITYFYFPWVLRSLIVFTGVQWGVNINTYIIYNNKYKATVYHLIREIYYLLYSNQLKIELSLVLSIYPRAGGINIFYHMHWYVMRMKAQ